MSNNSNDFIKALHTIQDYCLSINCEACPLFRKNGLSVCEFKPYLWGTIPNVDPRDRLKEVFREESSFGGDLFHISQIERIIDGEDWL